MITKVIAYKRYWKKMSRFVNKVALITGGASGFRVKSVMWVHENFMMK